VILSKDACQKPYQGEKRIRYTLKSFENLANHNGQGYPGNVPFNKRGVDATKEELGAGGRKLETEHRRIYCTLGNEI
jgi:hypothetical protein